MSTPHKLGIFDLDGTLIHYELEFFLDESLRIIHHLGYDKMTRQELHDYAAANDLFAFLPERQREEFNVAFHELFDESAQPLAKPLEGALHTLEFLAQSGLELAICTARASLPHQVEEALQHTGFMDHISVVSTRGPLIKSWGDKSKQLEELLKRLNFTPKDAFMVGDNPIDITSARRANLDYAVAVLSGVTKKDVLLETAPDLLISDVTELRRLFPFER